MSYFKACVYTMLFALCSLSLTAQTGDRDGDQPTSAGSEIKDPNRPTGLSGTPARATGGPDAFGYTWDDSVPFVAADISGTGTAIFSGDDVAGVVALGGNGFNIYGVDLTQVAMASNGYISTDPTDTGPDLSNDCPLPATPSTGGGSRRTSWPPSSRRFTVPGDSTRTMATDSASTLSTQRATTSRPRITARSVVTRCTRCSRL